MDIRKIQDKVLADLEGEMDDRRAGIKRKPLLTIDISAGGEDEFPMEEMSESQDHEQAEGMEEAEETVPNDVSGWAEYLKKRYGKA